MNFINKAKEALSKHSSGGSSSTTNTGTTGQPAGQGDDYLDKGLAAAQKQFGMSSNKETNEKITDAGRGFYEKQTGSKVNSKFSN